MNLFISLTVSGVKRWIAIAHIVQIVPSGTGTLIQFPDGKWLGVQETADEVAELVRGASLAQGVE